MANQLLNDNRNNITLDDLAKFADGRAVYALGPGENVNELELGNVAAIIQNGIVYTYDPDDTTSRPSNTILRSNDNPPRTYKSTATQLVGNGGIYSVRNNAVNPPVNPQYGESYLIFAGATGEFASRIEHIATWTQMGWLYTFPFTGKVLYMEDEQRFWHFNGTIWIRGFNNSYTASSIPVNALQAPAGLRVEQIRRTVPDTRRLVAGKSAFIVDPNSPSGDWAGQGNKIAVYIGADKWEFIDQEIGMQVYNLQNNRRYEFNSTSWVKSEEISLVESYTGIIGATFQEYNLNDSTRSGWVLNSGDFLPPIRSTGDFIEIQLIRASGEIAVESTASAPDSGITGSGHDRVYQFSLDYGLQLDLYSTPDNGVTNTLEDNIAFLGNYQVVNYTNLGLQSRFVASWRIMNPASVAVAANVYRPRTTNNYARVPSDWATPGLSWNGTQSWDQTDFQDISLHPEDYTLISTGAPLTPNTANAARSNPGPARGGAIDQLGILDIDTNKNRLAERTIILKGRPNSQIRIALIVLSENGYVATRATNPSTLPVNARNLQFTIKYKYYTNTIS